MFLNVVCCSTVIATPPHIMKKFIVYEEKLMELFKNCPVCSRHCAIKSRTVGTVLHVDQACAHCEFHKVWTSQPYVNNIPAGNLQLAAAVLFTGSSFLQVTKVRFMYSLITCEICLLINFKIYIFNFYFGSVYAGIQHSGDLPHYVPETPKDFTITNYQLAVETASKFSDCRSTQRKESSSAWGHAC